MKKIIAKIKEEEVSIERFISYYGKHPLHVIAWKSKEIIGRDALKTVYILKVNNGKYEWIEFKAGLRNYTFDSMKEALEDPIFSGFDLYMFEELKEFYEWCLEK